MPSTPSPTTPPAALPLLSKGRHRDPSRGACFMEYTSLLAGEPFSDAPRCVDAELASTLRGANDMLSDEQRPALAPLLGRAIGLVVARPEDRRGWFRRLRGTARPEDHRAATLTAKVHAAVAEKFVADVGRPSSKDWNRWYGRYARVSELFWDLMSEPTSPRTSRDYSSRLVQRLELLHECYEEALREFGLPARAGDDGTTRAAATTAEAPSAVGAGRPAGALPAPTR